MTKNKKVKIDMSLEEYMRKVKESIKHYIKDKDYINKLDESIERSYYEEVETSQILGTNLVSPSGYCYAASLMYPDII